MGGIPWINKRKEVRLGRGVPNGAWGGSSSTKGTGVGAQKKSHPGGEGKSPDAVLEKKKKGKEGREEWL